MLLHRIAYDWGIPVRTLLEQHTSAELTELFAYARKEPHGYEIENWRVGMIAATVANVTPRKKGSRPLKPNDFYPNVKSGTPQLNEKQLRELERRRKNGNSKRRNS